FVGKRLPVGYRHVLPVEPALLLAAGAVLAPAPSRPRLRLGLGLLGLGWVAASTALVHPHEISFVNELGGGTGNGWRLLAASNYAWGQALKDRRDWMARRRLGSIQLGYFGPADPAYYGIDYRPLPSFTLPRAFDPDAPWPPHGLIAVSSSLYWGLPWDE